MVTVDKTMARGAKANNKDKGKPKKGIDKKYLYIGGTLLIAVAGYMIYSKYSKPKAIDNMDYNGIEAANIQ